MEALSPKGGAMRSSVAAVRYRWGRGHGGGTFEAIAKFAPAADSLRDRLVFVMQGCHEKEANFYSELLKFGTCMAMIQREVSMIACI